MKKIYLSFLTILLSAGVSYSQTVITPSEIFVDGITAEDFDVVAIGDVFNQSGETKDYIWERTIVELTEGWATAVCDNVQCYLPNTGSAAFSLDGNSDGTMDVHVYPSGFEGAAIIEVKVTNVNDDSDFAEATYNFNQTLSAPERITNTLKIYPNPVVSEFFIDGVEAVERLEIYSVNGKLVKEVQSFGSGSVNVDDLETGNYILRMWDEGNSQISTNVLTVQ